MGFRALADLSAPSTPDTVVEEVTGGLERGIVPTAASIMAGEVLGRLALAAITIKAHREGTAIRGGLKFSPDEPFPKAH